VKWIALVVVASCGHGDVHRDDAGVKPIAIARDASAPVTLPPAPPVPLPVIGLPALPASAALDAITPDRVALGELLFFDARLASDGKTSCATCHDPSTDFAGAIGKTAGGEANLRRTPSLANLAWRREYAWDGRFDALDDFMHAHVKGQLGNELAPAMAKLAAIPAYAAHLERLAAATPGEAGLAALEAYALTRYEGDSPWDRFERAERGDVHRYDSDPNAAGYAVFTSRCGVCHTPPLYTDEGYHAIVAAGGDAGRGTIDPKLPGAFATPSLRGAARRIAFLHDGRATTLEAALDAHFGGSGSASNDPALAKPLSAAERDHVLALVRALSSADSPTVKPTLP
jgi:cytochrome c peroxidase